MLNATIEKLLVYASARLDLNPKDLEYKRNELLALLGATHPYLGPINVSEIKNLKVPDNLVKELEVGIKAAKLCPDDQVEQLITDVMGKLTPLPSQVHAKFNEIYRKNRRKATDYLYHLSIYNNYIQKTKIDENIHWMAPFPDGKDLEITINLAKPEKDNKQIAQALKEKEELADKYPQCVLCKENVGFAGNHFQAPRQNLRVIPLKLDDENWFVQYSPFVYYDRHCIVIDEIHEPMAISRRNISKLLAFTDQFPHFFVGSNSDLPIVGGSILNHVHFQGGAHVLPMMKAKPAFNIRSRRFHFVNFAYLDWYNSTLLLKSNYKNRILEAADYILKTWREYSDESVDILAQTAQGQHNTLTVIARKLGSTYHLYLIFRNNRCSKKYPEGIFHAHPEHHAIKKEGIGLIEAMGLFILPARLKRQLGMIEEIFSTGADVDQALKAHPDLKPFAPLLNKLKEAPADSNYRELIKTHVNETCRDILVNTAVFKDDEQGIAARDRFLKELKL
ncbi:MAG: galactose-1-phosphate uridylyltransferase [Bacilli bacterium]